MAKYDIGSIVESKSGKIFYVKDIPDPDHVIISDADLTQDQLISRRIIDEYKVLPPLGFKSNQFADIDTLKDWVDSAPLRLLYAVLIDQPTQQGITEKDFQKVLRPLITSKHKWNTWWDKTKTLCRDNPCSIWSVSDKWRLRTSHQQPEALPLPIAEPAAVDTPLPDENSSLENPDSRPNQRSQPLSDTVVQLVSGLVNIGDIKVVDRPRVVKRLIDDGVWGWLNSTEGLSQTSQYDRTLTELLTGVTDGNVPVTQIDLLLKLMPLLTSKNARNRLSKVLSAARLVTFEKPYSITNQSEWQISLAEILVDTAMQLPNDSDTERGTLLEIAQLLGLMLNSSPVLVQTFIESLGKYNRNELNDPQYHLAHVTRMVLNSLNPDVRLSVIAKSSCTSHVRQGIWLFLSEDQSGEDAFETIRELVALTYNLGNEEVCYAIQELAGSLSENLIKDHPSQIINLCMNISSIGCRLHESLEKTMQLLISDQLGKLKEQPVPGLAGSQIVEAFQKEINRQIANTERLSKREISKLTSVSEQNILQIKDLESKLEAEQQFANRLKNDRGVPEEAAAFYSKIQVLTSLVEVQQRLIMRKTENPNDPQLNSFTLGRLTEILAINGAQPIQQVGDIVAYDSMSHERLEPSDNSPVTVVSPGFNIRNHDGNIVIIRKAYVKDC